MVYATTKVDLEVLTLNVREKFLCLLELLFVLKWADKNVVFKSISDLQLPDLFDKGSEELVINGFLNVNPFDSNANLARV